MSVQATKVNVYSVWFRNMNEHVANKKTVMFALSFDDARDIAAEYCNERPGWAIESIICSETNVDWLTAHSVEEVEHGNDS